MQGEEYKMNETYLDQNRFAAIAYNAVGRASEVNNLNAYQLQHSIGNSGWSVGFMQWDFGQGPVRQEKVDDFLQRYQANAAPTDRFSPAQLESLETRLKTRGQTGNALTPIEQTRLNGFLRSDEGRAFVAELDGVQLQRKWDNVGEPLSRMDWLQTLGETQPGEVDKIVAMTAKLFNQNEIRGGRLLEQLRDHPMSADETREWIRSVGVDGLNAAAQRAIRSGCDNAYAGAELLSRLEASPTIAGRAWREEIHGQSNPSLSQRFSTNPNAQLLDKMFRDPVNGGILLDKMAQGTQSPFRIPGTSESASVSLDTEGVVTTSLNGRSHRITPDGHHQVVGEVPARLGDLPPGQQAVYRAAQTQLGPVFRAQGHSAESVDTLSAACVRHCGEHPDMGAPERFLVSRDGARVAMVHRPHQINEIDVQEALGQSASSHLQAAIDRSQSPSASASARDPQPDMVR